MDDDGVFRVLSLDGGGTRGVYMAAYLQALLSNVPAAMRDHSLDAGKAFDLIVGTSTGGIVACALAAGVPLPQVIGLYQQHSSKIFSRKVPSGPLSVLVDLAFRGISLRKGTQTLHQALEEIFAEETLGAVYKRRGVALCITATDLTHHRGWVFKTPHFSKSNKRDNNIQLKDICLATSAAPIYRSMATIARESHDLKSRTVFVDGGLWANNPVLVALSESLQSTEKNGKIEIYCMGTSPALPGESANPDRLHRGLAGWRFGANVATLGIDAQQSAFDSVARLLARHVERDCNIVRFPGRGVSPEHVQSLQLDSSRKLDFEMMIELAQRDVDYALSLSRASESKVGRMIKSLIEHAGQ